MAEEGTQLNGDGASTTSIRYARSAVGQRASLYGESTKHLLGLLWRAVRYSVKQFVNFANACMIDEVLEANGLYYTWKKVVLEANEVCHMRHSCK